MRCGSLVIMLLFLGACAGTPTALPQRPPTDPLLCRGFPAFAARMGLGEQTQIVTRDTTRPGLLLVDGQRVEQHPTWDDAGTLGAFAIDQLGNLYVAPAPQVSTLDNPPEAQNRLYRVSSETGVMAPFVDLPVAQSPDLAQNPYAITGLFVECSTQSLYVTSLAGSTRSAEVGRVFRVDLRGGQITSQIEGIDALGVAAHGEILLVGRARTPEVWQMTLDSNGDLRDIPTLAFSVANQLQDSSGRVRRMQIDSNQRVAIQIAPFAYTLEPPIVPAEQRLLTHRQPDGTWEPLRTP